MSGHSKWAQIKRKKGSADAERGRLFSKIARAITLAVRSGDKNPASNYRLETAIEKARSVNMPKDVIERAIAKATNVHESALEEFLYEAYGPGGIALLIEGISDNKNRSTQEIKHLLSNHEGKLANPGTVQWLFEKRTALEIPRRINTLLPDDIELAAIDAGAESIESDENSMIIWTRTEAAPGTKTALKQKGITVGEVFNSYVPKNIISVSPETGALLTKLIDALEERDDVQNVYTNRDL